MSEVKWRRRWKPDLNSCSWIPLKNLKPPQESVLLAKAKFSGSSYEFLLTDLSDFWYEKLDNESLQRRSSKLNPNIEAPLTKIVDQIKGSLLEPGDATEFSLSKKTDTIQLTLISQLVGLPFTWNFKGMSVADDMGRDHLSLPLLAMVGELSRQKRELYQLLAAKDKQIDDYKAQGAQVTRKHYETAQFDVVAFENSMMTSKGFEQEVRAYGERVFDTAWQELYRNICTKRAWLTHGLKDLNDDSDNDEMQSGDGAPPGVPSVESWANRVPESIAGSRAYNGSPSKSVSPTKFKVSPSPSPSKASPQSKSSSAESTPAKDSEMMRRQALERRLEQEEANKLEKAKKKKKLKF